MITQPFKATSSPVSTLNLPGGRNLAYRLTPGRLPGVVFMGGFRSDMNGGKATAIEAFCAEQGVRCLCFDYSGHGQSSGDFLRSTIGIWKRDAIDMLDKVATGPNIIVGSSMGAWIMLLTAMERREKIAGLIGIAAAADFTERLIWQQLSPAQKKQIEGSGLIYLPSCSGEDDYPITRNLIEEARNHLVLERTLPLNVPVRLIHGTKDEDVPWKQSMLLMERIQSDDISVELVKDGGHRLSDPAQLALICRTIVEVLTLV